MWKLIGAVVSLLGLSSAAFAAFAIFQTFQVAQTPQIFYNIVSDGGAACNGDVQQVTRTVTITNGGSGNRNVNVTTNTFTSGDVGKAIAVDGAGNSGGRYLGTIASFTDAQNIVLGSNVGTVLTSTSTTVTFGTNDSPAFAAFNTWARANQSADTQTVLTIPNGSSCWFGSQIATAGTQLSNAFAAGIYNLLVEGAGATINSVGGSGFFLGGQGIINIGLTAPTGISARVETANIGDSTVTLTAASYSAGYISRFSVGKWIMIGGLDVQGTFLSPQGFPPNHRYFEWRQITAVCNNTGPCVGTATVTLDRPLTKYYCSCWPNFTSGNNFEVDQGGPATIYALNDTWPNTAEYRGASGNNLTISQEGQTYAGLRHVTYRYITFTGLHGAIPTQNETFSAINVDYGFTQMEMDKLVGTMALDGVTIHKIVQQSTSTDRMIIRNSTFTLGLDGGGNYTEITDSSLGAWAPGGPWAYGSLGTDNEVICTRCTVTSFSNLFGFVNNEQPPFWTKSGGVITMPLAAAQGSGPGQRFFVPDARVYMNLGSTNPPIIFACCTTIGSFEVGTISADSWPAVDNQTVSAAVTSTNGSRTVTVAGSSFSAADIGKTIIIPGARVNNADLRTWILGVSGSGPQDLTIGTQATRSQTAVTQTLQWGTANMYINTNQSGGWPDLTGFSTNGIILRTGGSWKFTCDTCSGDPNLVGMSVQAGATPQAPLNTYNSRTFTPSASGSQGTMYSVGLIQSLRINVTNAATAAGAVSLTFGQFKTDLVDHTTPGAVVPFDLSTSKLAINLKQAGDRVITSSGITCNGVPGGCSGDTFSSIPDISKLWVHQASIQPWVQNSFTGAPQFTVTIQTNNLQ